MGSFPVYLVDVQIPELAFQDAVPAVGVPTTPQGFDGVACYKFLSRFNYGNFARSRPIRTRCLSTGVNGRLPCLPGRGAMSDSASRRNAWDLAWFFQRSCWSNWPSQSRSWRASGLRPSRCWANPELKVSATVDFKMFNADSVLAGLEFNLSPNRGGVMPRPVFDNLVVVDGWNCSFLIS